MSSAGFQRFAVDDDEIGQFSDFQRTGDVVFVKFVSGLNGGSPQRTASRERPSSSPSFPRNSGGALGAFVRVTPTFRANHSSRRSTGQSLPKAMRAPAAARSPAGSRILMRSASKMLVSPMVSPVGFSH